MTVVQTGFVLEVLNSVPLKGSFWFSPLIWSAGSSASEMWERTGHNVAGEAEIPQGSSATRTLGLAGSRSGAMIQVPSFSVWASCSSSGRLCCWMAGTLGRPAGRRAEARAVSLGAQHKQAQFLCKTQGTLASMQTATVTWVLSSLL